MKNFTSIFFLLLPAFLVAQAVTVSEEVSIREDLSYYLLDDQRGNVLLFHDRATKFIVQGFDKRLHKQWEKDLELDKKRPAIIDVASIGGDFCVFYTFRQKQHSFLKVHRYNPAANLVDSVTIEDLGVVFYTKKMETEYSDDKKIALLWNIENQDKINAFAFHMGQMKLLWARTFTTDGFLFSRDFHQMLVDNNGNMYMVLKKENRRSKQDKHYLEILECDGAEDSPIKRRTVDMQSHLTFDAYFTYDNLNHALVAGGLYGDDHTAKADGLFYLNSPSNDPGKQTLAFHPFDRKFVNILLEKDKSKNKGLTDVKVQDVVLRRDGGIILFAELAKDFVRGGASSSYYSHNGMRPIMDYYYDDLFLVSFHPTGELHWKNILHKKQYSQDDEASYSSYFLAKTRSALRVIFNDEIKSENTVSEYIISGNGDYDRNAVMNTEDKDLGLRFADAIQISANEFVVPSERRQRLKLVKVSYEGNQ